MKCLQSFLLLMALAAPSLRGGGRCAAGPAAQAGEPVATAPKVRFFLTEAEGKPGDSVTLVLSIATSDPLQSATIAINFDESKLQFVGASRITDGGVPLPLEEATKTSSDNADNVPGDQTREGWVSFELVATNDTKDLNWPVGKALPIYKMQFLILEKAPAGFTPVDFARVGPAALDQEPVKNTVELAPAALQPRDPQVIIPDEDLEGGGVIILGLGEIGFFLRGDATMDRTFDLSDPITTLNFLFFNGQPLLCEDSADANDDGVVDIADPIYTLYWLYSGGSPPPEPKRWGPDPTEDGLCCEQTGGCP